MRLILILVALFVSACGTASPSAPSALASAPVALHNEMLDMLTEAQAVALLNVTARRVLHRELSVGELAYIKAHWGFDSDVLISPQRLIPIITAIEVYADGIMGGGMCFEQAGIWHCAKS